MSTIVSTSLSDKRASALLPLRFALRELRGDDMSDARRRIARQLL